MKKSLIIDALLLVLLSGIAGECASVYVSHEHVFYWSDYSGHQELTRTKATQFRESPIRALYRTWTSTAGDYNDSPTLLLVPLTLIFGDSRQVYIHGLVLFYLVPFVLVLGFVGVKLIPRDTRLTYWLTVLLALLIPATWVPSLRGYPDTGGAALLWLAVLVYAGDLQLRSRRRCILIGLLLTGAVLFRRHFIFGSFAFYASVVLYAFTVFVATARNDRAAASKGLSEVMWGLAVSVLSMGVSLVLVGFPFVRRLLTTDFGVLYASFKSSLSEFLLYFGSVYGWGCWLMALAGLAIGVFTNAGKRPVAAFIAVFCAVSILVWLAGARQIGEQYSVHFTPFVVLGIALLWSVLLSMHQRQLRFVMAAAAAAFFGINAAVGLGAVDIPGSALLAVSSPPLRHADYNGIVRLLDYLHASVGREAPVYIAGSSELFGCSVLTAADHTLYGEGERLNILPCIHIDSRDEYPLEKLIQADYVVIATPVQLHLAPDRQRVVEVVVDDFADGRGIAQDFTCLPRHFPLANGSATVSIFRRKGPTADTTAFRALRAMQSFIPGRPGGQQSWIALRRMDNYYVARDGGTTCTIYLDESFRAGDFTKEFLYIDKIQGRMKVSGDLSISGDASSISLVFASVDSGAGIVDTTRVLYGLPGESSNFSTALSTRGAEYLTLAVSSHFTNRDPLQHVILKISHLAVLGD